jgi:hypothetical protein
MLISNYNERLFGKGFRRKLHLARFKWLSDKIINHKLNTTNVIELGCFDARSLEYISPQPFKYSGYDANWENGLDIARIKYSSFNNYSFNVCNTPSEFNKVNAIYSMAISLETLEHIPIEMLDEYIKKIAAGLNGYLIITVPNEKGLIFLIKHILKRYLFGGYDKYTFKELLNATLGRMHLVERDQHKGFDYMQLKMHLLDHFDLFEEQGIPFALLPLWLNTQVGFVMKSKPVAQVIK